MSNDDRMIVTELYLRHIPVDFKTGRADYSKAFTTFHWTWNAALMLDLRQKEQRKLVEEGKDWFIIETAEPDQRSTS